MNDITPEYNLIPMKEKVVLPQVPTIFGNVVGGQQQNATSTQVGQGNNVFKTDPAYGIWLGDANFASAPFSVNMKGDVLANSVTISGGPKVIFKSDTIDTQAKSILKDFIFSPSDYSGAFKSGDIAWNSATGAIVSGSGVLMYKKGIVGANNGATTFVIDGTTGNATFAGTLSGASGTFGTITAGTITGVNVYANQFRNLRWTVNYSLSSSSGWETSNTGGAVTTYHSSNIVSLSALDSLGVDATAYIQVGSFGINLNTTSTSPLNLSKSPMLEAVAICTNLTGAGAAYLRMGQVDVSNLSYIGFTFGASSTTAAYHDGSAGYSVSLTDVIDNTKWHKYRIQITPNGGNYDIKWYVDDVLEATVSNHTFTGTSGKNFGARVSNNWVAGAPADNAVMVVGAALFQQDY